MLVSAVFGYLFKLAGLKAGMIVGAMVGSAAYGCLIREVEVPIHIRRVVHVFIGAYIGTQFTREFLRRPKPCWFRLPWGFAGTVLLLLVLPQIMLRTTNMPYRFVYWPRHRLG